jgi:hypothetical protein
MHRKLNPFYFRDELVPKPLIDATNLFEMLIDILIEMPLEYSR